MLTIKKAGYYWVRVWQIGPHPTLTKYKGDWTIVWIEGDELFFTGTDETAFASDIAELGEEVIKPLHYQ